MISPSARQRLHPHEAVRLILEAVHALPSERVPVMEAHGRVAAEDVASPISVPRWDSSAMDGWAVRQKDLGGAGGTEIVLNIVEEIAAGAFPTKSIGLGECARVFTGAPVPDGADTVIRQEHAIRLDDTRVRIDDGADAGKNVRRAGEDIAKGSVALEVGTEIRAAQIGVLASIAQTEVSVIRAPRVALLATGDELASLEDVELVLKGQRITSSNSYSMVAMTREADALPLDLGIARDRPDELRGRLAQAALADLIVTSGGMSVGEHDHLRIILSEEGDTGFWRLRTRPGAPVGFGRYAGTPWIGLPGNPVSTMVAFELFVRPAIRKLSGHRRLFRRAVPVRMAERAETPGALTHFLRVKLGEPEDGLPTASLTGSQSSGVLTSMANADALLIVPEDTEVVEAGAEMVAMVLSDGVHVEEPPY